jgi:hypothetical protein
MKIRIKSAFLLLAAASVLAALAYLATYFYNHITIYKAGTDFGIDPVVRFKHHFGLEYDKIKTMKPTFAFIAFTTADGDEFTPYSMEIDLVEHDSTKLMITKVHKNTILSKKPWKTESTLISDSSINKPEYDLIKSQIINSDAFTLKWPTMHQEMFCIGCGTHGFYVVDNTKSNLVYWDNSLTFSPGKKHSNIMSIFNNSRIFRITQNQLEQEYKEKGL